CGRYGFVTVHLWTDLAESRSTADTCVYKVYNAKSDRRRPSSTDSKSSLQPAATKHYRLPVSPPTDGALKCKVWVAIGNQPAESSSPPVETDTTDTESGLIIMSTLHPASDSISSSPPHLATGLHQLSTIATLQAGVTQQVCGVTSAQSALL
ncbi:hypothetical protein BaRGS_00003930, partial [Batillaria attramentaria]